MQRLRFVGEKIYFSPAARLLDMTERAEFRFSKF